MAAGRRRGLFEEDWTSVTREEIKRIAEALIFVAQEPITLSEIRKTLSEAGAAEVDETVEEYVREFNAREGGLEIREVAGGYRLSTRPDVHEHVRKYLKAQPSARLSLAALETLAVIAYKQPITIPEILEIRGVHSSSAIKTLLDRRLIVTRGRKECVGRPMLYGTSKDFLVQFGLRDLNDLPSLEDFQDMITS